MAYSPLRSRGLRAEQVVSEAEAPQEVIVGEPGCRLRFVGPALGEHVEIKVEGRCVAAHDSIVLEPSLAEYFEHLASLWRGWEGEQRWSAPFNHNVALAARHDGVGHVLLTVSLSEPKQVADDRRRQGDWAAYLVVAVEPSQLGPIARELRQLAG